MPISLDEAKQLGDKSLGGFGQREGPSLRGTIRENLKAAGEALSQEEIVKGLVDAGKFKPEQVSVKKVRTALMNLRRDGMAGRAVKEIEGKDVAFYYFTEKPKVEGKDVVEDEDNDEDDADEGDEDEDSEDEDKESE